MEGWLAGQAENLLAVLQRHLQPLVCLLLADRPVAALAWITDLASRLDKVLVQGEVVSDGILCEGGTPNAGWGGGRGRERGWAEDVWIRRWVD